MIYKTQYEHSGGWYTTIGTGDGRLTALTYMTWFQLNSLCNPSYKLSSYEGQMVQRSVSKARARKIAEYLVERIERQERFVIPPLIMTILPPSYKDLEEMGLDIDADKYAYPPSTRELQEAAVMKRSIVVVNDGQHRVMGIRMAFDIMKKRIAAEKDRTEKNRLKRLFEDMSRNDIAAQVHVCFQAEEMQQLFADINSNASKPSRSISLFFDKQDAFNDSVAKVILRSDVLRDRVDLERNTPSGKSDKVFGFAGVVTMLQELWPAKPKGEGLSLGEIEITLAVFDTLAPLWNYGTPEQLREATITPHLVFLKGLMRFCSDLMAHDFEHFTMNLEGFLLTIPTTRQDYVHRCVDMNNRLLTKPVNECLVSSLLKTLYGLELSPVEYRAERELKAQLRQLEDAAKHRGEQ